MAGRKPKTETVVAFARECGIDLPEQHLSVIADEAIDSDNWREFIKNAAGEGREPGEFSLVTEPEDATLSPTEVNQPSVATAEILAPLGNLTPTEYCSRHVEVRFQTDLQKRNFKRLLRGLQQAGETLANGKPIIRAGDAIKWLMEKI